MLKVVNDPKNLDRKVWSDFVSQNRFGNIFQMPEMYDVYTQTPNYEPLFIAVLKNDELVASLVAVIQKEYSGFLGKLTARSIIFGGPIFNDEVETLNILLKEYNKTIRKRAIYSQIRNFSTKETVKQQFKNNGFSFIDHLNIILDLSVGSEKLLQNFSRSRRRGIKRAQSENFKFEVSNDMEQLNIFFELLSKNYKRIKLPFPNKSHFVELLAVLSPNKCKIFMIKSNGLVIVALVALIFKNTMYGFYMGSTDDPDLKKQKPIDLLFWEVFKWAMDHNIHYFDWLGAGKPNKDYGVRNFKLEYGGSTINLGRFEKIHNPVLFNLASLGFKIWQKIY